MNTGRSRTQSRKGTRITDALLVGVTGGIGSGKTAVCREFERLGRTVLSADQIARELTERDEMVREGIRSIFGADVFKTDGDLRRKEVADLVFHDEALRKKLNGIIHPRVFSRIQERLAALSRSPALPYVIIEAALVFESEMHAWLDYTIVVDAPEEARIQRVLLRDGCSREEVRARIAAQMSAHEKRERADFIVMNTDMEPALARQVAFLDKLLTVLRPRSEV